MISTPTPGARSWRCLIAVRGPYGDEEGELTPARVAEDLGDPGAIRTCYRLVEAGWLETGTYRLMPHVCPDRARPITDCQETIILVLGKSGPLTRPQLIAALHRADPTGPEPSELSGCQKEDLAHLVRWGMVCSTRSLWLSEAGRGLVESQPTHEGETR